MMTRSIQTQSNLFLVISYKQPYPLLDCDNSQTSGDKIRVYIYICKRVDVVPVEYGVFYQIFHLIIWL